MTEVESLRNLLRWFGAWQCGKCHYVYFAVNLVCPNCDAAGSASLHINTETAWTGTHTRMEYMLRSNCYIEEPED